MKINKIGIILFFTSSIVSLILLEGGLRLSGYVFQESRSNTFDISSKADRNYDSERDYEKFKLSGTDTKKVIWAIGDSFTNAGNVDSNESYPAYLFNYLYRENYNYSVVNLGQCEDPTWGVYNRLKALLDKKNIPEIVIVLTGVSDPFYYTLNGINPMKRDKQNITEFKVPELSWYKSLRIYKAFRHIKIEMNNRELSRNNDKLSEKIIVTLKEYYEEILQNKPVANSDWEVYEKKIYTTLVNYREFVDGSKNEFFFKDKTRFIFNTLVIPQIRYYTGRLNYNDALRVLLKFGEDYPSYFWSDERNVPFALHTMSQLMLFQSEFTAEDLERFLNNSTESVPELRSGNLYSLANKFFMTKENVEDRVLNSRIGAWKKIIELSKRYKFKLVVQTYASNFKHANDMSLKIARENDLLLVDNYSVFVDKIKKYGRENLFADDNHFQPMGYKIMAENIFLRLKNNNYITK
jgi:lysophospholipase L1-like esterase